MFLVVAQEVMDTVASGPEALVGSRADSLWLLLFSPIINRIQRPVIPSFPSPRVIVLHVMTRMKMDEGFMYQNIPSELGLVTSDKDRTV